MEQAALVAIAGGVGALVKEIVEDNSLKLPNFKDGNFQMGFLGSLVIGVFVGYVIDGGILEAALAGFTGFSVIQSLLPKGTSVINCKAPTIEDTIRIVAKNECVDPELCIRVAKCESSLNATAVNINADGSKDKGLFQINEKYHPEVTEAQAFDPIFSTQFFCRAFKAGNLSWWNASKTCWDLTK